MRRFVIHIVLVIALVILSAYVLDGIYTHIFKTSNPRNKTQYVVQLKNKHIDYIFLGSSRVENHIDCEIVEKLTGKSCLNLGIQGGKMDDAAALLQILSDKNITYKNILLQVDYTANVDSYSAAFLASAAPLVGTNMYSQTLEKKLDFPFYYTIPFTRFALNDKLSGIREMTMQSINKKSNTDFTNGFSGKEGTGTAIKGDLPVEVLPNNNGVTWIRELANDKLVLFTAPYCKEASNRESFTNSLQAAYPTLFNYIDLFDNNEGVFVDCGHLNVDGARTFTTILTNDILLNK